MNPILMQALVEALLFLMLCDDEALHPDVAIKQVEYLSHLLKQLAPEDLTALLDHASAMADAEETIQGATERVEYLRSLGPYLGLVQAE